MEYMKEISKVVVTFDGTEAYRKDCRYIKGGFYKMNSQCFYINGMWYRINSGKIAFDHELKDWILLNSSSGLHNGVIKLENSKPVMGLFSENKDKNVILFYKGYEYWVLDEKILLDCSRIIEGVNGKYYYSDEKSIPISYTKKLRPQKERFYSFSFNYGSEPLIPEFTSNFERNFIGKPLLSNAWEQLDSYTFGVEFETHRGTIPEKHLVNNGLIACRDGSIEGFEYTTIPLSGDRGIRCIKNACWLLKKYCSCSPNESLHIHVGGYPRSTKYISSLYRLALIVEKEIYSLFPMYYADTSVFKRKGYCNLLYRVGEDNRLSREIFSKIYRHLSGDREGFVKFPTELHPLDRSGQHKWDVSPRYYWINFIPLIWGSRGTIEFRCHPPTVIAQKVINWLFIIVALLKYARKNVSSLVYCVESDLPKLTLKDILQSVYPPEITKILCNYITARKIHYHDGNDSVGETEIFSEEYTDIFKLEEFV